MVLKTVFEHINKKVLVGAGENFAFIGCVPREILGCYEGSMLVIVINILCDMLCSTGKLIGVIRGATQKFRSLTTY